MECTEFASLAEHFKWPVGLFLLLAGKHAEFTSAPFANLKAGY